MTITEVRNLAGHTLQWKTRICRKAIGTINKSFPTREEAVSWLEAIDREYPVLSGSRWKNRGVQFKVEVVNRLIPRVHAQKTAMAPCGGIIRGKQQGRPGCYDDCHGYRACLDVADANGWPGWVRV